MKLIFKIPCAGDCMKLIRILWLKMNKIKSILFTIFSIMCSLIYLNDNNSVNAQSNNILAQLSPGMQQNPEIQQMYKNNIELNNNSGNDTTQTELNRYNALQNELKTKETEENKKIIKKTSGEYLKADSNIEKMFNEIFSEELIEPLHQYGYNYFKNIISEKFLPVGDKYTLGPGDSICLYFWGDPVDILKLNGFYALTIDRDGKIFIPNLGVFYVWGIDISDIKDIINKALSKKFRRFEIDVTLGKLREFPVYVSGYVNEPGVVMISGINNLLDVFNLTGGISKNGSLRNIIIKRVEKSEIKTIKIDLYDLFINGKPLNVQIKEGDSILVNSIGRVAALAGSVKREGIYEIADDKRIISEIINFSGGLLPSANSPLVKIYRYENKNLKIYEGSFDSQDFLNKQIEDGDLIVINPIYNLIENEIVVKGYIAYPGRYSYKTGLKLSNVIETAGLLPDTNMYSGEIRRDKNKEIITFSPVDIASGKNDHDLEARDIINFYPKWFYKPIVITGEVNNPRIIPYYKDITLLDVLKQVELKIPAGFLKAEIVEETQYDVTIKNKTEDALENINQENKNKINFKTVYLSDLLIKAKEDANIQLKEGSKVLINTTEPTEKRKTITLLGEVTKPGVYDYQNGMTLYSLLQAAGGCTGEAYPRGIIFIRKSAMKLQKEQINLSLLSMKEYMSKQQDGLTAMGSNPEEKAMLQMAIQQYEQLYSVLEKKSQLSLGRIALDIPNVYDDLKSDADNIALIEDDYIYIPPKPNYVLVLGNVYNQMSLPYNPDKTLKYYLSQLGGSSKNADEDDIYIIKANGKIISKQQFSTLFNMYFMSDWENKKLYFARDFENMILEQGDSIVVPTKLVVPVMWRSMIKDITQIIFQSIATAVLATKI